MGGLDKGEKLSIDHEKAKQHIERCKTRISNAFIARVAILNGAIQDFNAFRDLPPESNMAAEIFWLAFSVISPLVPVLRIGEFMKAQHSAAANALILARALGTKARHADKVILVATKGAEAAGKAAQQAKDIKDIIEQAKKTFPAIEDRPGHISRRPILELINDLNEAPKTWEVVEDLLMQEWTNRLADLPTKGSLEELVKKHLTPPDDISESDADEIWNLYLFEMIRQHCMKNVYWDHVIMRGSAGAKTDLWDLVGINGNQKKFITQRFGPTAKRKRYFTKPVITSFDVFLKQWKVTVKETVQFTEVHTGNRV